MTGDFADIVSRLSLVLPKHWFPAQSPNVNAVLTGIAAPWAWLYDLITYVIKQTRIGTATDDWLDLVAFDYFGRRLARKPDELDPSYRSRIKAALLRDGATRTAVSSALEALTGTRPDIFEPANCMDTGCYGALTSDGR